MMKKTLFAFLMVALATLSSCQKDITSVIDLAKDSYPVFTASINDASTRTALNSDKQMEWVAGDRILIKCDGKSAVYEASASGQTAAFTYVSGDELPAEGTFEAFYPEDLGENVPLAQTYVDGNVDKFPMKAQSETTALEFDFVYALLEIKLGAAQLDPQIFIQKIAVEAGSAKIALNCATPVELTGETKSFFVAVPEGTYAAGKLIFALYGENGCRVFTSKSEITLQKAHVTPATIMVDPNSVTADIMVTNNATSASPEWAYAHSFSAAVDAWTTEGTKEDHVIKFLHNMPVKDAATIKDKAGIIEGTGPGITLDVSERAGVTMTLEGTSDISIESLTFDGGLAENLNLLGIVRADAALQLGQDVVIQNICRSNSGKAGSVFNIYGKLTMADNALITDCANLLGNNGGAIWLPGGGQCLMKGTSKIAFCVSKQAGGAFCISNGSVLTMKDDAAIGNCGWPLASEAGTYGGAIYNLGEVHMDDNASIYCCTAKTYGGAIYSDDEKDYVLTMSGNAKISQCSASAAGAIYSIHMDITMEDNASITDCLATGNGGAIIGTTATKLTMKDNAAISNCHSGSNGGGIRIISASASAALSGNVSITDCDATTNGDAISMSYGTLTIDDDVFISSNGTNSLIVGSGTTINGGYFHSNTEKPFFSGSVITNGGYFNIAPPIACLPAGKAYIPEEMTFNSVDFHYTVGDNVTPVASVNGTEYLDFGEAVAAAIAYDGADAEVSITLLSDVGYSSAMNLTNASGKAITLDLNGYTLSTGVDKFITTTGTLTITDLSKDTNGKVVSTSGRMIYLDQPCNVTISSCTFECNRATYRNVNNEYSVISLNGASVDAMPSLTICGGAKVYSTNEVKVIQLLRGILTTENCEINCGGGYATLFVSTSSIVTLNEGTSLYSTLDASGYGNAIRMYNSGNVTINGGYYYGGNSVLSESKQNTRVKINGGYFNTDASGLTTKPVLGEGKSFKVVDPAEVHYHNGVKLEYGFKVE